MLRLAARTDTHFTLVFSYKVDDFPILDVKRIIQTKWNNVVCPGLSEDSLPIHMNSSFVRKGSDNFLEIFVSVHSQAVVILSHYVPNWLHKLDTEFYRMIYSNPTKLLESSILDYEVQCDEDYPEVKVSWERSM